MWNFFDYAYASLSNKTELHFAFEYEGPVPPLRVEHNIYNFDETEYAGAFVYRLTTLCASCRYADLETRTWKGDGCEVRIIYIPLL